jgi:hypothetical protein
VQAKFNLDKIKQSARSISRKEIADQIAFNRAVLWPSIFEEDYLIAGYRDDFLV